MTNRVQQLKDETTKSDIKVTELLRRVKVVASEMKDKKFLQWIENELNGYSSPNDIPEFRTVIGEPKGFNPVRGWIPAIFTEDKNIQQKLSTQRLRQPVSELENLVSSTNNSLQLIYPDEVQKILSGSFGMSTQYAMLFPTSRVVAVLDSIRNKILDWLIEIDTSSDSIAMTARENLDSIFPHELISKLPNDLKILADDFNFNFSNERPVTCMLILRRALPLAIVRRFQKDNREGEIKNENGELLEPKGLLEKARGLLSANRIYTDIVAYKILTDGAQHSYTLNVHLPDARGAGIAVRVLFDDIFPSV